MKRFYNKFIDMVFYSKLFRQARAYHYKMAYDQGQFDYHSKEIYGYVMEGMYED